MGEIIEFPRSSEGPQNVYRDRVRNGNWRRSTTPIGATIHWIMSHGAGTGDEADNSGCVKALSDVTIGIEFAKARRRYSNKQVYGVVGLIEISIPRLSLVNHILDGPFNYLAVDLQIVRWHMQVSTTMQCQGTHRMSNLHVKTFRFCFRVT
jgi:hypothetical protein